MLMYLALVVSLKHVQDIGVDACYNLVNKKFD